MQVMPKLKETLRTNEYRQSGAPAPAPPPQKKDKSGHSNNKGSPNTSTPAQNTEPRSRTIINHQRGGKQPAPPHMQQTSRHASGEADSSEPRRKRILNPGRESQERNQQTTSSGTKRLRVREGDVKGMRHQRSGKSSNPQNPSRDCKTARTAAAVSRARKSAPANGGVKMPKKYPPGVAALREIRHYQRTVESVIPKAPFTRLIRGCMRAYNDTARITSEALLALQLQTEAVATEILSDSQLATIHGKRVTVRAKDVEFIKAFNPTILSLKEKSPERIDFFLLSPPTRQRKPKPPLAYGGKNPRTHGTKQPPPPTLTEESSSDLDAGNDEGSEDDKDNDKDDKKDNDDEVDSIDRGTNSKGPARKYCTKGKGIGFNTGNAEDSDCTTDSEGEKSDVEIDGNIKWQVAKGKQVITSSSDEGSENDEEEDKDEGGKEDQGEAREKEQEEAGEKEQDGRGKTPHGDEGGDEEQD